MRSVLLTTVFLLCGCASGPDRAAVLNGLVGQPETEVVRVLGVPGRVYETGGHKFLGYVEQRTAVIGGGPFFAGGGFYGPRFGYVDAFPAEVVQRGCETTVDVVGGRMAGGRCGEMRVDEGE